MRRLLPPLALVPALIGICVAVHPARALPPGHLLDLVHSGLSLPTTIRFAPDGRLFYTELFSGRVMVFAEGTSPTASEWATVPIAPGGEHGMLGMTFHPQFPDSPFVYVFHTRPSPIYNRLARLRDQGGVGVDYTVLLDSLFADALGRFGGRLAFGPDGMLYVTIGDCTIPSGAQDPNNALGSILRLTPMGKPAPGNPYGANNPVCAIGVRNPYGLCFDPVTGYGYFTDNGPLCDDELNRFVIGTNYGWGNEDSCGTQPPGTYPAMVSLTPTVGMTGCTTYRGTTYGGYNGNLFMGTYVDGSVRRVVHHVNYSGTSEVDTLETWVTIPIPDAHVLDVTQGPDGRIWFSTYDQIWRVVEPGSGELGVGETPPRPSVTVAPNPSTGFVSLSLPGPESLDGLSILDVSGRQVRTWTGPLSGRVVWDGRGDDGRPVGAGVYWVRGIRGERMFLGRLVRASR